MSIDLRLALPVAVGWAVLCIATLSRTDGSVALWSLGSLLGLIGVSLLVIRGAKLRAVLVTLMLCTAASLLLMVRWHATPQPPLDPPPSCVVEARFNAGAMPPVAVSVVGSECAGEPGPVGEALLLQTDLHPDQLGFGTWFTADCSTWSFAGTWMLDCDSGAVTQRPLYSKLSADWRSAFQEATAWLPGDGGALLAGLAIGDTSRTDDALQSAMLEAGLSHLTAVSGANCAIVTGAAFAFSAAVGARRWVRVSVGAAALVLFAVLVTPEPSVVRASLMAGIALLGLARGQPRSALPLIGLAVFLALFVNPGLALTAGFGLSVLATTGLIVHSRPIGAWLSRWLPRPLAFAIAVPAAAQLWCLPVLVLLDNGVQPLSVLWNLAAAPAAPIVTVIGIVACVVAQFTTVIGGVIACIAWPAAAWIGALARLSESLPPVHVPWPTGGPGALLAALVVTGLFIALRRRRLGLAMIATSVSVALSVSVVPAALEWGALRDWRVIQCDIGQGHATLVRSGDSVVLIDTGPDEEALAACLALARVDRLDAVFITHFDHDHVGALDAVVGRTPVILHGPPDEDGRALLDGAAARGVETRELVMSESVSLSSMRIDVLWPKPKASPGNEASLVLAVHSDADSVAELVILGDTGQAEQRALLGAVPQAHLLLAAHHCSSDQEPGLYSQVQARAVLVGVGENTYGHPTPECIAAIENAGSVPLSTDSLGTVAIMGDGTVWTQRPPDP